MKEKASAVLFKAKISKTLSRIPMKDRLITALSTLPLIAAATMSGSCAAGCPYGLSCSYPGQCRRFTDSGDGICDLAQTSPGASSNTETTSSSSHPDTSSSSTGSSSSTRSSKSSTATQDPDQSSGASAEPANTNPDTNASAVTDQTGGIDNGSIPGDGTHYNLIPISILLMGGYLFTYYLFSKGILNQQKHRRIWNLLLTTGYMGTGITGVLLILIINLGVKTALNPSIVFWHVELAILMVLGTIIHIHLYWKPFKNIFRVLFGFKNREKSKKIKSGSFSK